MPPFLSKIVNKFSNRLNDGNMKQEMRSKSLTDPNLKKKTNKKISKRGFGKSNSADKILPKSTEFSDGGELKKSQPFAENLGSR